MLLDKILGAHPMQFVEGEANSLAPEEISDLITKDYFDKRMIDDPKFGRSVSYFLMAS